VLLCLERAATAAYPITVERHQGRYFIAGGHRFHVYDDWKQATLHTWRTAAAMVWLPSPEKQAAAAPPPRPWQPPAPPAGPPEPTEAW
jgi:hypothetical protein